MRVTQLLIGGDDRLAANGKTFARISPVSGKPVTQVSAAAAEDADDAVAAAAKAFPIWSRRSPVGMRIAERIETGICHINGATVHDEAQMPFGGVKASGFGRFGGQYAFTSLLTCSGSRYKQHL